jgi:hypothetical protein
MRHSVENLVSHLGSLRMAPLKLHSFPISKNLPLRLTLLHPPAMTLK